MTDNSSKIYQDHESYSAAAPDMLQVCGTYNIVRIKQELYLARLAVQKTLSQVRHGGDGNSYSTSPSG